MLGKCLWKMYIADDKVRGKYAKIAMQDVLEAFIAAIENLPKRKDSRQEPILEPYFKLVSVIHKLVQRGDLEVSKSS